jgi:hypothetical protein
MKPKPTAGGARKGAGRKPTGRTVITRSVSMPPEEWDFLDHIRCGISRGQFVTAMLRAHKGNLRNQSHK